MCCNICFCNMLAAVIGHSMLATLLIETIQTFFMAGFQPRDKAAMLVDATINFSSQSLHVKRALFPPERFLFPLFSSTNKHGRRDFS